MCDVCMDKFEGVWRFLKVSECVWWCLMVFIEHIGIFLLGMFWINNINVFKVIQYILKTFRLMRVLIVQDSQEHICIFLFGNLWKIHEGRGHKYQVFCDLLCCSEKKWRIPVNTIMLTGQSLSRTCSFSADNQTCFRLQHQKHGIDILKGHQCMISTHLDKRAFGKSKHIIYNSVTIKQEGQMNFWFKINNNMCIISPKYNFGLGCYNIFKQA